MWTEFIGAFCTPGEGVSVGGMTRIGTEREINGRGDVVYDALYSVVYGKSTDLQR